MSAASDHASGDQTNTLELILPRGFRKGMGFALNMLDQAEGSLGTLSARLKPEDRQRLERSIEHVRLGIRLALGQPGLEGVGDLAALLGPGLCRRVLDRCGGDLARADRYVHEGIEMILRMGMTPEELGVSGESA